MGMNDLTPARRRKATNVSLDKKLVEEARALGINVSRACEGGLERETRLAREAALRAELAPTVAYWNRYLEEHGMPFADLRSR